jgi:kynurenine formamidase
MNHCALHAALLSSRAVRTSGVLLALLLGACSSTGGIPLVSSSSTARFPDDWTVIDLTRVLDKSAPFVPHAEAFPFERVEFKAARASGWRTGAYSGLEHMGTHLAAPLARLPAGASVEAIPPQQLVAPFAVVDVPLSAQGGGVVTAADVAADERLNGPIPLGAVVALRTGRGALASSDPMLLSRRPDGALSFPGWSDDAVRLLAIERRARAIATDAMAIDSGANVADAPAQAAGSAAGVWFVVGLGDLRRVPPRGATVVVGAIPIAGAAGAPARVLALVPARK